MQLSGVDGSQAAGHQVTAAEMADVTKRFFDQAAREPELSNRMAFANTVVHLRFQDAHGEATCTVWLDKSPITAEQGLVGSAEVELWGPVEAWMCMVRGDEHLSLAIARGDIEYRGPVRKFLRVVPILRAFDFEVWRQPESHELDMDGLE